MATEIERKFKVTTDEYKQLAKPLYCKQGYFNTPNEPLVRVRIMGEKAYLTLKGKNKGISRLEFEYEIPVIDAQELLSNFCSTPFIEKNRFIISIEDTTWEVDEFLGDNLGLVIAEVEISSEDANFQKPSWVGPEVSDETKYYNYKLVNHPYSKWNETKTKK
jgi:adenylate cyclase|tara:strand:- start:551 stop:1036 length:486 start_codon:yes stop_codon:yes gene_type:complete